MIARRLSFGRLLLISIAVATPSVLWGEDGDASGRACAKTIVRPMVEAKYSTPADVAGALERCLEIVKEPRPGLGAVGADVYRFEFCTIRPSVHGWFFASQEGDCVLLAGDLPDLLGLPFSLESASNYTITALNSLVQRHPTDLESSEQVLLYVTEVLRLTAPLSLKVVLGGPEDIWKARAGMSERGERKLPHDLRAEIKAPSVKTSSSSLTLWTVYTWEDPGGLVTRNEILLWPDGRLSLRGRVLASEVGPYSQDVRVVF